MREASPQDVYTATGEWPDAVIQCRIYGHAWRPLSVVRYTIGGVVTPALTVTQRCSRCHCYRAQDISGITGSVLSKWRMTYRHGYLLKDMGRVAAGGRDVLRLAALRNLTIHTEAMDEE